MITIDRVVELDRLVSGAINDCEQFDGLEDGHILEFWRGARMIVDELKIETTERPYLVDSVLREIK